MQAKLGFILAAQSLIGAVVFDLLQRLLEPFGQSFLLWVVAGESESLLEQRGGVPVVMLAVIFGEGAKHNLDPYRGEHRLDQLRRQ